MNALVVVPVQQEEDFTLNELRFYFRKQTINITARQLPNKVRKLMSHCMGSGLHNHDDIIIKFTSKNILYRCVRTNFLFHRDWDVSELNKLNANLTRIKYVNPF